MEMNEEELQDIYDCNIKFTDDPIDSEPHQPKSKNENADDEWRLYTYSKKVWHSQININLNAVMV